MAQLKSGGGRCVGISSADLECPHPTAAGCCCIPLRATIPSQIQDVQQPQEIKTSSSSSSSAVNQGGPLGQQQRHDSDPPPPTTWPQTAVHTFSLMKVAVRLVCDEAAMPQEESSQQAAAPPPTPFTLPSAVADRRAELGNQAMQQATCRTAAAAAQPKRRRGRLRQGQAAAAPASARALAAARAGVAADIIDAALGLGGTVQAAVQPLKALVVAITACCGALEG